MSSDLRLATCSYRMAKFACEQWHYSRSIPTPPLVIFGVWESDQFIGSVIFGRGASNNLGKPYGLTQTECCELVRIALSKHLSPVTRIVSIALKLLKKTNPGIRLVVSFADPRQRHLGVIYQAGNWVYLGRTQRSHAYVDASGREWHSRQVSREKSVAYRRKLHVVGLKSAGNFDTRCRWMQR